jgi:hypothetical protein
LLPSSRVMIDQSPDALTPLPCHEWRPVAGARSVARALAARIRVECVRVIPALLVIIPPFFFAGAFCARAEPANASPTLKTATPLRIIILVSVVERSNAGSLAPLQTPFDRILFRAPRDTFHAGGPGRGPTRLDREHQASAQPFDCEGQLVHLVATLAMGSRRAEIRGLTD